MPPQATRAETAGGVGLGLHLGSELRPGGGAKMGPYEHVEAWAVWLLWQQGRAPRVVWRDVGGQL